MNYNKITTNEEILEALNPVPNFKARDDIKPWIHEKLDPRGINLVIERSDASKVVFKCKNLYRKSSTPRSTTTKIINGKQVLKRVRRSIPEDSCPFRLRVSYSVKYKNWSVNIIKHEHNFSLCSNFGVSQPSPIDHASVAHARQYGNQGLKQSPSSAFYTPTSTTPSPASSSYTNSPALSTSSTTPHEFLYYEPVFKKTKPFDQSPLYQEIDPLDQITFANDQELVETPTNINDQLNYVYAGNSDSLDADFSTTLSAKFDDHFTAFANEAIIKNSTNHLQIPTPTITSTNSNTTQSQPILQNQPSLPFSDSNLQKIYNQNNNNSNSLNIKQEEITENDPLMYLLSSTNSSYSFEELENLDKAMGIDANDKILMGMFQGI